MGLFHRCVLGSAVVLAQACTLLIPIDGLSGEAQNAPTNGDANTTEDVARFDASTDAGADSGDPGDSATGPFCESMLPAPTFCSDFDTVALPAGWDSTYFFGPGALLVDGVAFKSAPKSLLTTFAKATGQGAASVRKTLPKPISDNLTIDFDVLVETQDGQEVELLVIELRSSEGKPDRVFLRYKNGSGLHAKENAEQTDGTFLYAQTSSVPFAAGAWRHVSVLVTQTANSSAVTLTVDGTTASGTAFRIQAYPSPPKLELGLLSLTSPTTAWRVRFDDFVANLK